MRPQHDGHDGRPSPQSQTPGTPSDAQTPGTPSHAQTPGTPSDAQTPGTASSAEVPGNPSSPEVPGTSSSTTNPSPRAGTAAVPSVPRSGDTWTFAGRVRRDRPEGKRGRHRLDAAATQRAMRAMRQPSHQPLALPSAGSPPSRAVDEGSGEESPAPPAPATSAAESPAPTSMVWHDLVDASTEAPMAETAGLPVPAEPAGLPVRAKAAGLPVPAEPADLPVRVEAAGLPVRVKTAGLPVPAEAAGLPAPAEAAGLPAERRALDPQDLPEPPHELSLARRDSVVPRQATPPAWQPEAFGPWGAPPDWDPEQIWDSTEEHEFSWGLSRDIVRVPRQLAAGDAGEPPAVAATAFEAPRDGEASPDEMASVGRYLTPAGPLTPGLGPVRALRGVKIARYAALGLIALLGIAAAVSQSDRPNGARDLTSQSTDARSAAAAADRSQERAANPPMGGSAQPMAIATPTPKATPVKKATPKPSVLPLVAGLDRAQMTNAQTIVRTGLKLGVPSRGLLIGLMTAMQESDLYNQASAAVPESFNYPHQGDSVDYDSCGLFQQRTSMGWGTVAQIMDPVYSSAKFFKALLQVDGWQSMDLTLAAQAVQGSAFPYAYAQHEYRARTVLNALI